MATKSYLVKLRMQGYAEIEVEADDEDEALEEAKSRVCGDDVDDWEPNGGIGGRDHEVTCLDDEEDLDAEDDEEYPEDDDE